MDKPITNKSIEYKKLNPTDFLLFGAIYQEPILPDGTITEPKQAATVVLRKDLATKNSREKLYETLLKMPFIEGCSMYSLSEINYHFGYQIMEDGEKWKWSFCLFVEEDELIGLSARYFSHADGTCDTEDEALKAVHELIQKYENSDKEKKQE